MAASFTCEINGLGELGAALDQLPGAISRRLLRGALQAAGDVIQSAVVASAEQHRVTGALAGDIITKVHVDAGLEDNYVLIGPGYDRSALNITGIRQGRHGLEATVNTADSPGVYGLFVEEGHAPPHTAADKRAAHRRGVELEFGGKDTPPHPWLQPAFDATKDAAMEAAKVFLTEHFHEVAEEIRSLVITHV